ncbi:MAG: endonuclease/exonuclease/phosphatase family protein [Planctomycetota bacterium]
MSHIKRFTCAFFVLGAVILAVLVHSGPVQKAGGATESDDLGRISVLTFNIRFDHPGDGPNAWPHRREMVNQILSQDWQVIGLQEVLSHQLTEILDANPRFASVGVGRDDGVLSGEVAPILYDRSRFTVAQAATFWLSDTPDEVASVSWDNVITRICTWAELVDLDSRDSFWVYNTHWDHVGAKSRLESAKLISKHIESHAGSTSRVILMGDFNAGENSEPMKWFTQEAKGRKTFRHAFRAIHPEAEQVGTFHAWRGGTNGGMIDSVLVPFGVRVIDSGINHWSEDGRYPSDHYPVWAEIEWEDSPNEN